MKIEIKQLKTKMQLPVSCQLFVNLFVMANILAPTGKLLSTKQLNCLSPSWMSLFCWTQMS